MAAPKPFDGSPQGITKFLRALFLVFEANRKYYEVDPARKILYALSFMSEGTAEGWAGTVIDEMREANHTGTPKYVTWAAFESDLVGAFESPNLMREAQLALATIRQGSRPAAEFFIEFDTIRPFTKFNDATLLFFATEALTTALNNKVSAVDPAPTTYDAYKKAALRLDSSWRAVQTSKTVAKATVAVAPAPAKAAPAPRAPFPFHYAPQAHSAPVASTSTAPPARAHDGVVPMDIDRAKGGKTAVDMSTVRCYNCQQFGHRAYQCPLPPTAAHVRALLAALPDDVRKEVMKEGFPKDQA